MVSAGAKILWENAQALSVVLELHPSSSSGLVIFRIRGPVPGSAQLTGFGNRSVLDISYHDTG